MSSDEITVTIVGAIYIPILIFYFLIFIKKIEMPNFNFRRLLKFNLFSFLIIGLIVSLLSHTNYLNYESPIPYKNIDKITFKNFRGLELFKKELFGSKYFAYVVTSIECKKNEGSVFIEAYFHPSRSFVYNQNTNSDDLLTHELYHFKITEVFARKGRKKISELKKFNYDEVEEIIRKTRLEERKFQEKYDYDTFHSYVYKEQKNYERKIDSLLYLLKEFENPKINLNEKN